MTLIGIKFEDKPKDIKVFADEIENNSEKPVAKTLFIVKTYCLEPDILVINKEFIPTIMMKWIYLFMMIGASIPMILWGISLPLFIVIGIVFMFSLFSTPIFNYLMFFLMIRKRGYKGRLRML